MIRCNLKKGCQNQVRTQINSKVSIKNIWEYVSNENHINFLFFKEEINKKYRLLSFSHWNELGSLLLLNEISLKIDLCVTEANTKLNPDVFVHSTHKIQQTTDFRIYIDINDGDHKPWNQPLSEIDP